MDIRESLFERFVKTYSKSEVIFQQNAKGKEMYVIYSGKVKLVLTAPDGREKVFGPLEPGDFFGEMALIDFGVNLRSATAIAEEDNTRLLALDRAKFTYLIRHQPDFALIIMRKLAQRLREANVASN
jgi:CRP/FNR family cyclic AMP-dependent transcriptional regulator